MRPKIWLQTHIQRIQRNYSYAPGRPRWGDRGGARGVRGPYLWNIKWEGGVEWYLVEKFSENRAFFVWKEFWYHQPLRTYGEIRNNGNDEKTSSHEPSFWLNDKIHRNLVSIGLCIEIAFQQTNTRLLSVMFANHLPPITLATLIWGWQTSPKVVVC